MTQADLEDKLDRVIGWINNCDQKASILLAFIGVAFPFSSHLILQLIPTRNLFLTFCIISKMEKVSFP